MENKYLEIFSLSEVKESKLLLYSFLAICFSFFVSFYNWISISVGSINSIKTGSYVCPPYFQSCYKLFFYEVLPFGYSQNIFYVLLFLILSYGVISALKGNWMQAHFSLFVCFLWKIVWGYILSYGIIGNFDYYDMVFAFIFLFASNKEYFLKVSFVFLYFLSSTIKIGDGWILANYFRTLTTGMPIFPEGAYIYVTNFAIFMQIVGAWFLLSENKILQKLSFLYFLAFHIYSGFLVQYRYISITIPMLYILFSNSSLFFKNTSQLFVVIRVCRKTAVGYIFLLLLLFLQINSQVLTVYQEQALKGVHYGLYMFDANHQCYIKSRLSDANGKLLSFKTEANVKANNRCDLYSYFYKYREMCKLPLVKTVSLSYEHSVNGYPYMKVVDEQDICGLEYDFFGENTWINKDPKPTIRTVFKNYYGKNERNEPKTEKAFPYTDQSFLDNSIRFYYFMWGIVLLFVFVVIWRVTNRR